MPCKCFDTPCKKTATYFYFPVVIDIFHKKFTGQ